MLYIYSLFVVSMEFLVDILLHKSYSTTKTLANVLSYITHPPQEPAEISYHFDLYP